jgi:hypothetical protein
LQITQDYFKYLIYLNLYHLCYQLSLKNRIVS